jgi:hypothetical protein
MRLVGGGEYTFPGYDGGDPTARQQFLDILARDAPQVRRDLEEVRPYFDRARLAFPTESVQWLAVRVAAKGPLRQLRDALLAWAKRYSINAEWMLATALRTVAEPKEFPIPSWARPIQVYERFPAELEHLAFDFHLSGWNPALSSRHDSEQEITAVFREKLTEYLDEVARKAEALGGVKARETRRRSSRRSHPPLPRTTRLSFALDDALAWFVGWQCARRRKVHLRIEADLSPTAFDMALKRAADALGFQLRLDKGGRPQTPMPTPGRK